VYTFLAVRIGLGILAALSEAWLAVSACRWMQSKSLGWLTTLLLAGSSGTFTADTCEYPEALRLATLCTHKVSFVTLKVKCGALLGLSEG
jgi:hypothetical protein